MVVLVVQILLRSTSNGWIPLQREKLCIEVELVDCFFTFSMNINDESRLVILCGRSFFVVFVEHINFVFNLSINQTVYIEGAFFAIIFSTIAQFGDLIISYFKRMEKIKDTGKILPGHGGIFDRIDGLMFVVIFAYIMTYFNSL